MHSTSRNKLLRSKGDKIVYLYCSNRLLKRLESDDYSEKIPKRTYNMANEKKEEELDLEELENSTQVCSNIQIDEHLAIDESLQ